MVPEDVEKFERGMQARREVLGDEHVHRSIVQAGHFSAPLQEFITEQAWGTVWVRPGLDRKSRSFLTIAALVALGKTHELAVHVRGALRNGATVEEIREALIHLTAYLGMPAVVEAFRAAEPVIQAWEEHGLH